MKVLFDHQIFSYQTYGGASRYYVELINEFNKLEDIHVDIGLKYSKNEYLKRSSFFQVKDLFGKFKLPGNSQMIQFFISYLINKNISQKKLYEKKYDIFHPTFYDPYFFKDLQGKPFVLTILDMIPENFPELFPVNSLYSKYVTGKWIAAKKTLAEKADKIIAISENTKKDVIKFYGIDEKKIKVIYLGNSLISDSNTSASVKLPDKYILFVGTRNNYKNFNIFIEAISVLLKKDNNLHIVCIGGGKFTPEESAFIDSHGILNRIYQYNVSDNELAFVYKHALAFVFPSIYEGFGIPIIEAFSCGCPVILSNSSSFPEVALNGALYFNCNDKGDILDTVERVIYNSKVREELIAKGLERARFFTWEKTAMETKELYKEV